MKSRKPLQNISIKNPNVIAEVSAFNLIIPFLQIYTITAKCSKDPFNMRTKANPWVINAEFTPPEIQREPRAITDYDNVPYPAAPSNATPLTDGKATEFNILKESADDSQIAHECNEAPVSKGQASVEGLASVEVTGEAPLLVKTPAKPLTEFRDETDGEECDSMLDEEDMKEIFKAFQAQRAVARRRAGVGVAGVTGQTRRRTSYSAPEVEQVSSRCEKSIPEAKDPKEKENVAVAYERETAPNSESAVDSFYYHFLIYIDLTPPQPIERTKQSSTTHKQVEKEPGLRDIANVRILYTNLLYTKNSLIDRSSITSMTCVIICMDMSNLHTLKFCPHRLS